MVIPNIIQSNKTGRQSTDLISYQFEQNRTIYLTGEINDELATVVIAQLEYLDTHGSGDIKICINSPGGSVSAGFAVYDVLRHCRCDISTVCCGMAASMAAFLLAAGTKGKRFAYPNAEVMIHQPLGESYGQASDIELSAKHLILTKQRLNCILSEQTGQTVETISKDSDRDNWMSAADALSYGIIDQVL